PENTLAAFDLALEQGSDGFEFDVRLTRNRQIIICHDPRLNRLSVRNHTLKQLQASCASQEGLLPCLNDVLNRYARQAFLNIEIKVRHIEPLVVGALKRMPPRRGYFISSFFPGVIRRLHDLNGALILGTLSHTRWQLRRWSKL